jgi:hypothetical protein
MQERQKNIPTFKFHPEMEVVIGKETRVVLVEFYSATINGRSYEIYTNSIWERVGSMLTERSLYKLPLDDCYKLGMLQNLMGRSN